MLIAALSLDLAGSLILALWMSFCFRIRDGGIYVDTSRLKWMGTWSPLIGALLLAIGFTLQLIVALKK